MLKKSEVLQLMDQWEAELRQRGEVPPQRLEGIEERSETEFLQSMLYVDMWDVRRFQTWLTGGLRNTPDTIGRRDRSPHHARDSSISDAGVLLNPNSTFHRSQKAS